MSHSTSSQIHCGIDLSLEQYWPGHLKFDNTVKEIEVSDEACVTVAFLVPSLLGGVSFITFTRIKRDT